MKAVLIFRTHLQTINITCNHHSFVVQKYHKYGIVLEGLCLGMFDSEFSV